jgi:hypothetical protein
MTMHNLFVKHDNWSTKWLGISLTMQQLDCII